MLLKCSNINPLKFGCRFKSPYFTKIFIYGCAGSFHCCTQAFQLWSPSSAVAVCGLSCSTTCGILVLRPWIKPASPAFQGRFLTIGVLKLLQSCPTLCGPMDCSPQGSSVHGILQARILGWVAMPSSRESSRLRD